MAKTKTKFVCQNCGYTTAKWMGRCPECGTWDSLAEELETPASGPQQSFLMPKEAPKPKTLDKVMLTEVERLKTGINEFDRVLGGGLVPGSLVLLGGDPGIGKSTMLLDAGIRFSAGGIKVLYVSGEESEAQTAMRARRLGKPGTALLVMTATDLDAVLLQAKEVQPQILVIDSIQTMYNPELQTAAGSVGQANVLLSCCVLPKQPALPLLLSGTLPRTAILPGRAFWNIWLTLCCSLKATGHIPSAFCAR